MAHFYSFIYSFWLGLNDFIRSMIMFYSLSLQAWGGWSLSACISLLAQGIPCCIWKAQGVGVWVCWYRYNCTFEKIKCKPGAHFEGSSDAKTLRRSLLSLGAWFYNSGKVLMATDIFSSILMLAKFSQCCTIQASRYLLVCFSHFVCCAYLRFFFFVAQPSAAAPAAPCTSCIFWPRIIERDSPRANPGRKTSWRRQQLSSQGQCRQILTFTPTGRPEPPVHLVFGLWREAHAISTQKRSRVAAAATSLFCDDVLF